MAAMLRSQNIPTKLESDTPVMPTTPGSAPILMETGWVDNIIEFDGIDWQIVDPGTRCEAMTVNL